MSSYEIIQPGGSVERWNDEPGSAWMARLLEQWQRSVWLNPVPRSKWDGTQSIGLVRHLIDGRMYLPPPGGLDDTIQALSQ